MTRPRIVGIVNITKDSFSDGGQFLQTKQALQHAESLLHNGADILEFGPASSHPDAEKVTAKEEIERLENPLRGLSTPLNQVCVDSWRPETQAFSLQQGVGYLNDIRGFPVPEQYALLAEYPETKLIVMHAINVSHKANRTTTSAPEVFSHLRTFFSQRITAMIASGISEDRIIIDPGMGFFLGNTPEPSVEVLRNLDILRQEFHLPILVSVSRKSFLGALTEKDTKSRGPATLAAELYAAEQGVDYIRTHDTGALNDALTIWNTLKRENGAPGKRW